MPRHSPCNEGKRVSSSENHVLSAGVCAGFFTGVGSTMAMTMETYQRSLVKVVQESIHNFPFRFCL